MARYGTEYDRPFRGGSASVGRGYRYGGDYGSSAGGGGEPRPLYGYRTGGFGYRGFVPGQRGAYDRGYKSRSQTDYGDPFGDRTRSTPFRVTRGEFQGRGRSPNRSGPYDRGNYGARRPDPYDRAWWW